MAKKNKSENRIEPIETRVESGVGVVLFKGNKVLIGERMGSHGAGVYSFPGGHLEAKDALTHHPIGGLGVCAEREVLEETGIICRAFSIDHFRDDLFTTFDILSEDGKKIYTTPYILAEYLHGGTHQLFGNKEVVVPREPNKCKRWEWVTLDELVELVKSEKQKSWIPVPQVVFYLKQLWRM